MSEVILSFLGHLSYTLSASLDGSCGRNRSNVSPLIGAKNDLEAIERWLKEYANKTSTTYRNYRKDAERLLLWCIVERQKPLSALEPEDLLAFGDFLSNPTPYERWCSGKKQRLERWQPGWKPFVGALSAVAKAKTFANLRSLFNYLVEMDYLSRNPFKAVQRQLKQNKWEQEQRWIVGNRILGLEEWQAVQDALNEFPQNNLRECQEKMRLKFLIALLFFAGLRVQELTSHTMAAFKKVFDQRRQKDRWWLVIKGKGDKFRKIPVNQSLLEALNNYRRALGLADFPNAGEMEPLVRSFRKNKSITASRINQLLKALCHQAAVKLEKSEPEKALKLRKVSAHWFRHLSFSMQDLADIKKQHIKENAGHSSERTTEIYVHAIDNLRHEEMEKLSWKVDEICNSYLNSFVKF